jgi:MFS family permease
MLDKKNHKVRLLFWVCISAVLSFSGFAFWPVFLIELGPLWTLTNTQIGWISGGYFIGYVVATPILVGLTDRIDSKLIFIFGCLVGIAGNLSFILFAESFLTAFLAWSFIGCGLAGTYMPGLQILNARLKKKERINAVPWYTATFSIGTAISFLLMGFMLINFNYLVAINLNIFFLVTGGLLIYIFVLPQKKSIRFPVSSKETSVDKIYPFIWSPHVRTDGF